MDKKLSQKELENIFDEVDKEIEEAFKTPEGTKKYFDELDDFIENMSGDELTEEIDTMLHSVVKNMLSWTDEKIEKQLSNVPIAIIKEYLRCIKLNKDLQEENEKKISILKNIIKKIVLIRQISRMI